jgi:hypothetical protein
MRPFILDFGGENENLPSEFERRGSILLMKIPWIFRYTCTAAGSIIDLDLSIFTYMLGKYGSMVSLLSLPTEGFSSLGDVAYSTLKSCQSSILLNFVPVKESLKVFRNVMGGENFCIFSAASLCGANRAFLVSPIWNQQSS